MRINGKPGRGENTCEPRKIKEKTKAEKKLATRQYLHDTRHASNRGYRRPGSLQES